MHSEVQVVIPAPVEVVWALAQDPHLRPVWDVRIAKYEVQGAQTTDATVRITFRAGFLRPVANATIIRWAPPYQSALSIEPASSNLVAPGAGSWTFREKDGHTTLTSRFTLRVEGLPWWLPPVVYKWMVERDTLLSFHRLRKLVMERRR